MHLAVLMVARRHSWPTTCIRPHKARAQPAALGPGASGPRRLRPPPPQAAVASGRRRLRPPPPQAAVASGRRRLRPPPPQALAALGRRRLRTCGTCRPCGRCCAMARPFAHKGAKAHKTFMPWNGATTYEDRPRCGLSSLRGAKAHKTGSQQRASGPVGPSGRWHRSLPATHSRERVRHAWGRRWGLSDPAIALKACQHVVPAGVGDRDPALLFTRV